MATYILTKKGNRQASKRLFESTDKYKKAYERLADDVFSRVDEGEGGKYEMAFNRLTNAIYGDVGESVTTPSSLRLQGFNVNAGDSEDDDVENGGHTDTSDTATNERPDELIDDEKAEKSASASRGMDFIKSIRDKHPVLSKDEERKMIDEYLKRGDRDGLNKELVLHNIALVAPFIKNFYLTYHWDSDEMVSMGYEALCKAAKHFEPSRGIKFSTFAYSYLRDMFNRRKEYGAGERVSRASRSLDAKVRGNGGDSGNTTYGDKLLDTVDDRDGIFGNSVTKKLSDHDYKDFIDRMFDIAKLDLYERRVIKAIYIDGISVVDANKELGMNVSKQTMYSVIDEALYKMRHALTNRGFTKKADIDEVIERMDKPNYLGLRRSMNKLRSKSDDYADYIVKKGEMMRKMGRV